MVNIPSPQTTPVVWIVAAPQRPVSLRLTTVVFGCLSLFLQMDFDTGKFIVEIQNQPTLWNPKCADYSSKNLKQKEWEQVVNIYGAALSSEEKKKLS